MASSDFNRLLETSQQNRPSHVPETYVRIDHWGKGFEARLSHYEENSETKKYWKAVREKLCRNSGFAQKVIFKPGQKYKGTGTWAHPLIAAHYAAWLNADFAVLVNSAVYQHELPTGA